MLLIAIVGLLMQATAVNPRPHPTTGALRFYPERAWADGIEGGATIHCTVKKEGVLADCTIAAEWPDGAGFGDAALRMAPYFRMHPARDHGVPVDSVITIPFRFELPKR